MFYIVGYTFVFNPSFSLGNRTSVQEQLAYKNKLNLPQKVSSIYDVRFIVGDTYKLSRIYKLKEEEFKVCYLFSNLTNNTLPDIDVILSSTGQGDEYIAAISSTTQQLRESRNTITKLYENASDL